MLSCNSASPKRIGMDIRHTPRTLRCAPREWGYYKLRVSNAPPTLPIRTSKMRYYTTIAAPADSASEMRYSLETPFVRSAAEDAWGYSRPTPSALRRCATTRNESVVKKIFRLIFYCIFSKQTLQLVIEAFSKMMLLLITNIIAYHIPVSERISQRTVLFCPSFEKREILIVVTKKLAGLHLNHPHKFRDRY